MRPLSPGTFLVFKSVSGIEIRLQGRVLIPLRAVAEALGGKVAWDAVGMVVYIETPAGMGETYLGGGPAKV